MDATRPPKPSGGWSGTITPLPNAVVATTDLPDMIQPSGVFDASGAYVHQAVLWRGRPLMVQPASPEVQDHLPGRWIWAGVLLNHFGHFLTESTGRLWALDAIQGAVDGFVFIAKREAEDEASLIKDYHRIFFDQLGLDVPIKIITKPTRVELLEVPGQGFGIGRLATGTDAFRRFVQGRFAKRVAPSGSERLYISRSELGSLRGSVLEETRLERYLEAVGYEIFHPQKHTLTEQIARYKAARQIVALDGSALHLVAMVATSAQEVAIIKRRDSGATDSIVAHLASFSQREPLVLDVILQDWIRSDRRRADRFSFGELDFAALGKALGAAGFALKGLAWASLTAVESQAAVHDIEAKLKRRSLTFKPVARQPGVDAKETPEAKNARREQRMARRLMQKAAAGG